MPSTYTSNLGIELPADGELDGVWGDVVNDNMSIIDRAVNGSVTLSLSGTSSTLTTSDGVLSDGQYKLLVLGGTPSGTHTITIAPNDAQKIYFVRNTTAQSVVFTQGSGGNVTIATGDSGIIYSNGGGAGAAVVNITNDFAMSSVKITGGSITGITDLAVADGGTGASDAATARTNLGLTIGTNVQAYDAGLQSISGLVTSADQMIYTTASDTYATTSLTAAGRALIDDADAAAQRTTLGLGTIATQNSASVSITGGSITGITDLAVADGGTGASDAATARTNLGLAIGSNVQAYDAGLQSISGLVTSANQMIYTTASDTYATTSLTAAGRAILDDADAAAQRTTLGLGTIATQAANSVSITGGSITGITDLAVADGGTGASTAADARTNLGLAIGSNVQAYDAGLQSISGLTTSADQMIYTTAADTYATTSLTAAGRALLDDADAATQRATLGLVIGTNVQAYDVGLQSISGLTTSPNQMIYTIAPDTYATASLTAAGRAILDDADAAAQRTTLGLGTIATQSASSVSITGGSITGITDLAVADGGTGVSTITGIIKGNGTSAFSAAVAGTDYQAPITGAATTITSSNLTASRALASDGSGKVAVSTTTSTELGYVSGVTSAIQTQLDAKSPLASPTFTGTVGLPAATVADSVTTTADDDGTFTTGTYTPTPVGGNMKRIVNGGAFTLAAPTASGDYTLVIQITNTTGAGAITLSGFNRSVGSAFTTTNGDDFMVFITKCNGFLLANTVALQ